MIILGNRKCLFRGITSSNKLKNIVDFSDYKNALQFIVHQLDSNKTILKVHTYLFKKIKLIIKGMMWKIKVLQWRLVFG